MSTATADTPSIPVPVSLTTTTPSLPSDTQAALISHLRTTGSIPDLASLLTDSLARTGWTDRVRALSLELLRNGSCDTFPELMAEVMRRAKIPKPGTAAANGDTGGGRHGGKTINGSTTSGGGASGTNTPTGSQAAAGSGANGVNNSNGAGAIAVSKEWSGGPDGLPDVRIPESTVDAGVVFLQEKIRGVVEVVEDDDSD